MFALLFFLNQKTTVTLHTVSGFSIEYPRTWIVEKSNHTEDYTVREQNGRASVTISSTPEPRLGDAMARAAITREIERDLKSITNHEVEYFEWINSDRRASPNGYVEVGVLNLSADRYNFTEIGLLDETDVVRVHGEVLDEFVGEFGPIVNGMLLSLKKENRASVQIRPIITAEEAKRRVENLPGVANYGSSLSEDDVTLRIETKDGGDVWVVDVFALEGGIPTEMRAGTWRVNKSTGAVSRRVP